MNDNRPWRVSLLAASRHVTKYRKLLLFFFLLFFLLLLVLLLVKTKPLGLGSWTHLSLFIFEVILHHWGTVPKTIYSMIFQKCIGPDMFHWIGLCMREVCALPSALLVKIWYFMWSIYILELNNENVLKQAAQRVLYFEIKCSAASAVCAFEYGTEYCQLNEFLPHPKGNTDLMSKLSR